MKKILISILFILASFTPVLIADVWVNGYTKSNGTQVKGHYRSSPNNSKSDNWNVKGNTNPYTGKKGTKTYGNNYGSSYGSQSSKHKSIY